MMPKDIFACGLKLIGVWLFIDGITSLINLLSFINAVDLAKTVIQQPVPLFVPIVRIVISLYLFFGGKLVVNLAFSKRK